MTNASTSQVVTELAATRQMILDSFGDNDSEATDLENMSRLAVVETRIACATFDTNADKAVGNSILMENKPGRWDDFQENLFLRMQRFA